jgi:hypothetical protein
MWIGVSCHGNSQAHNSKTEETQKSSEGEIYANEYGQIEIIPLNDTLCQTIFSNNEGVTLDTTLTVKNDSHNISSFIHMPTPEDKWISIGTSGILWNENSLEVMELSGALKLPYRTRIREIHDRPFYRLGKEVELKGNLVNSKDGVYLNGIYIEQLMIASYDDGYYEAKGTLKRETYDKAYYSTDESPQGKLGSDTTVVYYRMVMQDVKLNKPTSTLYRGTKVNSSNKAGIAWELADSEVYLLWGKDDLWPENELGETIELKGVYVFERGISWLKNVEYLD